MFPTLIPSHDGTTRLAVKVESVSDYLAIGPVATRGTIEGGPLARCAGRLVSSENDVEVWVVERHGYRGFDVPGEPPEKTRWSSSTPRRSTRHRTFGDDAGGLRRREPTDRCGHCDFGVDRACDLFFAAEREYWQRRNRAAQVQKARQDRLGLGWANHDHHTYRSSREHFAPLIGVFEKLGFHCRERFTPARTPAGARRCWSSRRRGW
jgi:hypothetical protein